MYKSLEDVNRVIAKGKDDSVVEKLPDTDDGELYNIHINTKRGLDNKSKDDQGRTIVKKKEGV
jgi:hypothetical protein